MPATTKGTPLTTRNNTFIQRALADLAVATAEYESAWRANLDHDINPVARRRNDTQMKRAATDQCTSRDALINLGIPAMQVHAIEAALVIAAAQPTGVRTPEHYDAKLSTSAGAFRFVYETVRDGGIV
jgi:hypothetical protein